ncbi:hypothetical protein ACX0HA_10540 [Flavobacterium hauense]
MNIEKQTKDKTYTLNSVTSYFDEDGIILRLLLPAEIIDNPYEFITYDISQTINGTPVNALLLFMKKLNDNGDDLSDSDDDLNEVEKTFSYSDFQPLNDTPGFCGFDYKLDDAVIIIRHEYENDALYVTNCSKKLFGMLDTLKTNLIADGNFQMGLNLMGDTRKTGMSSVPKK